MKGITKYITSGIVIGITAVCAYQLLLNNKAQCQLKQTAKSLKTSFQNIMKYQEVLMDDGSADTELLREHQQNIQNKWNSIGY